MSAADPDNKIRARNTSPKSPQEAGLRDIIDQNLYRIQRHMEIGGYPIDSRYCENKRLFITDAILSAVSAAVDGMIPETRRFKYPDEFDKMLEDKEAKGYNTAISELRRNKKEIGL